jgi:site-specific recombinase XerD
MERSKNDIHHTEQNILKVQKRLKGSSNILSQDKKLILDYDKEMLLAGLSIKRREKVIRILGQLSTWKQKPFEKCSGQDIKEIVRGIEESNYAEWTKHDFKTILKKFFKFVRKSEEYPPEVKWIKARRPRNHTLPEDLLIEEDVKKLIEAAYTARDKALISLLYESGARIEEILNLKIKNISFDEYGCVVLFEVGKTGARRIRIINSTPYLANWISVHPLKDRRESWLWINQGQVNRGKPMDYAGVRKLLKSIARRAGINKAVNPHNFRHSRSTFLAAGRLNEAQMCEYLGWVQGSRIPQTYVHLSGRDVDDAILKLSGLKKEEKDEKESSLQTKKCQRCGNLSTENFCSRCGAVLDVKTAIELQDREADASQIIEKALEDPKIKEALIITISKLMGKTDAPS